MLVCMLASCCLLGDTGLGRDHVQLDIMSRWMMGSCVGRHLLVVGVGRQIGVFCLWMCAGASRWVFWVWPLAAPGSFLLP